MSNSLLIDEPPIQVLPALAKIVGFNEAAILQVIHYWLDPKFNSDFREGHYWIKNVSKNLCQRFSFWYLEDLEYIIVQLEQSGILMTLSKASKDFNKDPDDIPTYHTINYELLKKWDYVPVKFVPATSFMEDTVPATNKNTQSSFKTEIYRKGPDVYTMANEDPAHFLVCELVLEIEERGRELDGPVPEVPGSRSVVCHYPRIADRKLKELAWEDPTLCEIFMTVFRIKIMQQLLSFCLTHHALNLEIFADGVHESELKIYRAFLAHQNQSILPERENTDMVIPVDQKTLDHWVDFMEAVTIKFRQTLWRDQKANPAIQCYLKSWGLAWF